MSLSKFSLRLWLERLESRDLMAADLASNQTLAVSVPAAQISAAQAALTAPASGKASAEVIDGALVVRGTDNKDVLSFGRSGDAVVVFRNNKPIATIELALFDEIIVYAYGGNDIVRLGSEVGVTATVYGGSGNDSLYGGAAVDFLYGEAGNDLLDGGLGDDLMDGGTGNDLFWDGPGTDTIIDIRGNRRLVWQA